MIFRELKIYIGKYRVITMLLYFQITLLLILLGSFLYFMDSLKYEEKELKKTYEDKAIYTLTDNYINENEDIFMERNDVLEVLKSYYHELNTNTNFKYLGINSQALRLENMELDDKFRYGYESGQPSYNEENFIPVKSVQMNKKAIDFFNIDISDGRLFNIEDFEENNNYIPIILGDDYKKYYDIGDMIPINYYLREFNAKVIGFAKYNSKILLNGNSEEYLNRYIIMPQIKFSEPKSKEEYEFQKICYLVRASGYICVEDNLSKIQSMMNEIQLISEKTGFEKYLFIGANPHLKQYNSLLSVISENEYLVRLVLICTTLLNVLIVGGIILLQNKRRTTFYFIHYMQGASIKQILIQQYLEISSILSLSFITYIILMNNVFKLGNIKIHFILFVFIFLLCLSITIISIYYIINNSLSKFLSYNE